MNPATHSQHRNAKKSNARLAGCLLGQRGGIFEQQRHRPLRKHFHHSQSSNTARQYATPCFKFVVGKSTPCGTTVNSHNHAGAADHECFEKGRPQDVHGRKSKRPRQSNDGCATERAPRPEASQQPLEAAQTARANHSDHGQSDGASSSEPDSCYGKSLEGRFASLPDGDARRTAAAATHRNQAHASPSDYCEPDEAGGLPAEHLWLVGAGAGALASGAKAPGAEATLSAPSYQQPCFTKGVKLRKDFVGERGRRVL